MSRVTHLVRLRRRRDLDLPAVLRTCSECAECIMPTGGPDLCDADRFLRDVVLTDPPPSWCPKRRAR